MGNYPSAPGALKRVFLLSNPRSRKSTDARHPPLFHGPSLINKNGTNAFVKRRRALYPPHRRSPVVVYIKENARQMGVDRLTARPRALVKTRFSSSPVKPPTAVNSRNRKTAEREDNGRRPFNAVVHKRVHHVIRYSRRRFEKTTDFTARVRAARRRTTSRTGDRHLARGAAVDRPTIETRDKSFRLHPDYDRVSYTVTVSRFPSA